MLNFYPEGDCPDCIRNFIDRFHKLKDAANPASSKIRNEYRDIWNEWIVRDTAYSKRASWSHYMNTKYGRARMAEFHTLCRIRSDYRNFLQYDIKVVKSLIELMLCPKDELVTIQRWVSQVNYTGRTAPPNNWVNLIEPKLFSEIILWRLMREIA